MFGFLLWWLFCFCLCEFDLLVGLDSCAGFVSTAFVLLVCIGYYFGFYVVVVVVFRGFAFGYLGVPSGWV